METDVVLLGTGLAPLVAASRLMSEGKSVLILNPDWDFFFEDSELPIRPFSSEIDAGAATETLSRCRADDVFGRLKPIFPGTIERWPLADGATGFRDEHAPTVRSRGLLWLESGTSSVSKDGIEGFYLRCLDAGLKAQLLDGVSAIGRFPGMATVRTDAGEGVRAALLPKYYDVDVARYRSGVLEFVRERLGPDRVLTSASQVDFITDGIRFHASTGPRTARVRDGVFVFWTPRLHSWIQAQAKRGEASLRPPSQPQLWEQWSLMSRDPVDPSLVGLFEDQWVWAEVEGTPDPVSRPVHRLSVLRKGAGDTGASSDSFKSLSRLCLEFLHWEKFSVRSLRQRTVFQWDHDQITPLVRTSPRAWVVPCADGPIDRVVEVASRVGDHL